MIYTKKEITLSKDREGTNLVIGMDLGNSQTTIYFNDQLYRLHTQITIDLSKKHINIGRQPSSLEEKLEAKHKSLQQSVFQQGNEQKPNESREERQVIDFLDLYIKGFTQKKFSLQQRQKDIFQSTLPKCFNYYGHEFQDEDYGGIGVVLEKGRKMSKNEAIVVRKNRNRPNGEQESSINIVQKIEEQWMRLDECIQVYIQKALEQIMSENFQFQKDSCSEKVLKLPEKIQLIINHRGFEGNPYLQSLSNIKSLAFSDKDSPKPINLSVNFIYTTTSLATYFYVNHLKELKESLSKSTIMACLDFGSLGFSFSIFKLYPSNQNVIESLQHFSYEFGGVDVTRIIVDMIIEHVKLHKGVDIGSTAQMTKELYKLAEETKIALSECEDVYVRIEGYPLQEPYGFYLRRLNLQRLIEARCMHIVGQVQRLYKKYPDKIRYMVVSGGSLNVPLFKQLLNDKVLQQVKTEIVGADKSWVAKGNSLWRQSGVIVLQKSQSSIAVRGDEDYSQQLLNKGESMPVRLMKEIVFPRGELAYKIKFYQNEVQIGRYVIESKNLEWDEDINFVAEKQENKALFVYSTKYLGDIEFKGSRLCNQLQINQKVSFSIYFIL